jgi:cytochrome d ubiquinol oxidase subunit I
VSAETLARWQFGSLTVYHYLIVPLSIGLTALVAVMQLLAYRRRGTPAGDVWDRSARFWGRIGQEFEFGMNWSAYSRFVGDIFGAPLAMEGLIAFFLESTFLGMWVFGRDILSPRVHLASIWLAAAGSTLSAYFILAANSFMQHPVGLVYDQAKQRVELTSIWKVLFNSTQFVTFPHTVLAAFMTGAALLLSVSAWHLRRRGDAADPVHRKVAGLALAVLLPSVVAVSLVGHVQGQIMTDQQPMKMAAAEALWNTKSHAGFSILAYGDVSKGKNKIDITIPDGLSILAKNRTNATVQGVNQVQAAEVAKYGPGSYVPVVWMAYWFFRLMIGFGVLAGAIGLAVLAQWRRGKLMSSPRLLRIATWTVAMPLLANSFGWLFTETARQPWLVYGLLKTSDGISPNVSSGFVLTTLIMFSALYGVLGVICYRIVRRIAIAGPDELAPPGTADDDVIDEPVLSLV